MYKEQRESLCLHF